MEKDQTIQNLNQMLAVATGRLDVVAGMLAKEPLDDQEVRQVRRYAEKARDNVDQMIERHNNGEKVVE
tara:strand:+ start:272 stop:475 length:204 start_codon:yes stop_codon:yes gene_type:complete